MGLVSSCAICTNKPAAGSVSWPVSMIQGLGCGWDLGNGALEQQGDLVKIMVEGLRRLGHIACWIRQSGEEREIPSILITSWSLPLIFISWDKEKDPAEFCTLAYGGPDLGCC